jgi:5-methyltetrahydropteroyltriglutamate--homocysteine methyltransferase
MHRALNTTTVGSFPKPRRLQVARERYRKGHIGQDELRQEERRATQEVIALQEELGLDLLVHGEMERGDMVAYFAERWRGFTLSLPVRSYGNRYYQKPMVVDRVSLGAGPVAVEAYREAQALTSRPVKGMLTGPYTLMDWSFNAAYPDRRSLVMDLAELVREEAQALEAAGCTYIQIDEPAISTRPEEIHLAAQALGVVTQGLKAKTITHICYGDFSRVFPALLELPVQQLDLEAKNRNFALLEELKRHPLPADKELALGVVDVHSHRVETEEEVQAGILAAVEVVPPERLWIDPDCGLKTRTWEEARDKLRTMVRAAQAVRDKLGLA